MHSFAESQKKSPRQSGAFFSKSCLMYDKRFQLNAHGRFLLFGSELIDVIEIHLRNPLSLETFREIAAIVRLRRALGCRELLLKLSKASHM